MKNRLRRRWKQACVISVFVTVLAFSMRSITLYYEPIAVPLVKEPTITRQKLLEAMRTGGVQRELETVVLAPFKNTHKKFYRSKVRDVRQVQVNSLETSDRKNLNYKTSHNKITQPEARRNIIMLETSGKSTLTPRQACAVESAARQNPNMHVTIYMTTPSINLTDGYMRPLKSILNLGLEPLDADKLFIGTRLESWYIQGQCRASAYNISHLSDAIRFLTIYQNGGIYLDLDVVVMKSLYDLRNCAGQEDDMWVAAGVMAFDKNHFFIKLCLEEFAETYNAKKWGYNGPELFTRVLKRVCGGITNIGDVSRDRCQGVTILQPNAFYAIPWQQWKDFFEEEDPDKVIQKWKDSYLIHVWNSFSSTTKVIIGSNQPYEIAARKYCPSTYNVAVKQGSF